MSKQENELELRRKVISGLKWSTVLKFASQIISWVSTLVVVRYLTPDDYGLNAMLEVPVEVGMLLGGWGMYAALIQKKQTPAQDLAAVFGFLLLVNGLIFAALLLSADMIAAYFKDERLVQLVWAISVIFLLLPFRTIPNALLDQRLDFKRRSQVDLGASICGALLSLVLAVLGAGVWALVASVIANYAIRAIVLMFIEPWIVRPTLKLAPIKPLLLTGTLILLNSVIFIATGKSLDLVAAPALGAYTIGLFAVAQQLALMPISRLMPIINQTLYPAFARLSDDTEQARIYLLKSIEFSSIVIFPLTIGMACVSRDLIECLFGEKWLPMQTALTLLGLIMPVMLVRQLCAAPLNAMGHARTSLWINIAIFLIQLAGVFIAVQHGLPGLIALVVLLQPLALLITYLMSRRIYLIRPVELVLATWPATLSVGIMAFALTGINLAIPAWTGIPALACKIALGGLLYGLALRLLFREQFSLILSHLSPARKAI
jgi:O-antigen/teichoic acid export membrane protein